MTRALDLSGQRFGRLVALSLTDTEPGRPPRRRWLCACDCGSQTTVLADSLRSGATRSCGCLVVERAQRMGKANAAKTGALNANWRGGRQGTCESCGRPTWDKSARRCQVCYTSDLAGEKNPYWGHFTSTDPQQGRDRAKRRKALGTCEECGAAPATDRHHLDGDTFNNDPSNLRGVCRRCHMALDGRTDRLRSR